MKEHPKDQLLRPDMGPGRLVRDGFLGEDQRSLTEIIDTDAAQLAAAGVRPEEMADALERLTQRGLENPGAPVEAGSFMVTVEEYLGLIGCPFKDGVRLAKRNTEACNRETGKALRWTDLSIHLIRAHGFFQGRGSPYRLEPVEVAAFLKLPESGEGKGGA